MSASMTDSFQVCGMLSFMLFLAAVVPGTCLSVTEIGKSLSTQVLLYCKQCSSAGQFSVYHRVVA